MKNLYILIRKNRNGVEVIEVWDDNEIAYSRCNRYNRKIKKQKTMFSLLLDSLSFESDNVYIKEIEMNRKAWVK